MTAVSGSIQFPEEGRQLRVHGRW